MVHLFGILTPPADPPSVLTPLTALRQKRFFGGRDPGERPTAAECDAAYVSDKSPAPFDRCACDEEDKRFVTLVMPPYI